MQTHILQAAANTGYTARPYEMNGDNAMFEADGKRTLMIIGCNGPWVGILVMDTVGENGELDGATFIATSNTATDITLMINEVINYNRADLLPSEVPC